MSLSKPPTNTQSKPNALLNATPLHSYWSHSENHESSVDMDLFMGYNQAIQLRTLFLLHQSLKVNCSKVKDAIGIGIPSLASSSVSSKLKSFQA